MHISINKKIALSAVLLSSVFITFGCRDRVDIKKAQAFGETAIQFEEQYQEIITDFYKSCMREARYTRPIRDRIDKEKECLNIADAETELLDQHNFFKTYTKALRKLSSDEIINDLDGAGELAGAITGLPIPGLEVVSPIAPIIKRIANAIQQALEDDFRRKVIQRNVESVNQDVQMLIAELSNTTEIIYSDLLEKESKTMDFYYADGVNQEFCYLDENKSPNCLAKENSLQLTAYEVDEQWQESKKLAKIEEKLNKLDAYVQTLNNMAIQHQELFESIE